MSIWFFAGVALTLWVLYDLLMGYTYLWEPVVRAENPWGVLGRHNPVVRGCDQLFCRRLNTSVFDHRCQLRIISR